ncbi:uncharacterized protein LOC131875750 [Cryptomeria japonica]|uniref:uncharacterized protein LOC131875750 n=1 Tax=Cryptomeria japonica TaxID=3369 RepID=UPI0027D9FBD6|nr:uncharacterized protein LOC131875750 [Cryptomeria japonica]
MVEKLKEKFLPNDYNVQLYKRLQNLKQKDRDVQAYTEEFHKLDIRAAHDEDDEEKVARYLNGLRYNIQDELSLTTPRIAKECYKLVMKVEEKLQRRQERKGRGRGNTTEEEEKDKLKKTKETQSKVRSKLLILEEALEAQEEGSTTFTGRCYNCNEIGHLAFKCPE